jgi:hypothetical protein
MASFHLGYRNAVAVVFSTMHLPTLATTPKAYGTCSFSSDFLQRLHAAPSTASLDGDMQRHRQLRRAYSTMIGTVSPHISRWICPR